MSYHDWTTKGAQVLINLHLRPAELVDGKWVIHQKKKTIWEKLKGLLKNDR